MHFPHPSIVQLEQTTRHGGRGWELGGAGSFEDSSRVLEPVLCCKPILIADVPSVLHQVHDTSELVRLLIALSATNPYVLAWHEVLLAST